MSECQRNPCVCEIVGRTTCIHEPAPEMVDAALNAWFASPPSETDQGLERSMRAALVAALMHLPDLPQTPFSLADIDQVLIAYGVATTETNVDRDRRWDAIKFVSEFLGRLRLSLSRPERGITPSVPGASARAQRPRE